MMNLNSADNHLSTKAFTLVLDVNNKGQFSIQAKTDMLSIEQCEASNKYNCNYDQEVKVNNVLIDLVDNIWRTDILFWIEMAKTENEWYKGSMEFFYYMHKDNVNHFVKKIYTNQQVRDEADTIIKKYNFPVAYAMDSIWNIHYMIHYDGTPMINLAGIDFLVKLEYKIHGVPYIPIERPVRLVRNKCSVELERMHQ